MSARRVLLWLAANVALVILVVLGFGLWLTLAAPSQTLNGTNAAARSIMIPVGVLVILLAAAVLLANAAWAIVAVVRQRRSRQSSNER